MAIYNNNRISIDLNELVATRGEFLFKEDDVVTVAPMSMESVLMYKMWVRKEKGGNKSEVEVKMNKNMGLLGKVSDTRARLEDFWRRTNSIDNK